MSVRELPGWPDVTVSSCGRIWRNGKEKIATVCKAGYLVVTFSRNNTSHTFYVHRLVLLAFVGEPPSKRHEALHSNGCRTDNRLVNLRWGTRKENVADAITHGTATIGHNNGAAKLTPHDVAFIKDMRLMGFYASEIAKHFDVSSTTVWRVTTNQTYRRAQ